MNLFSEISARGYLDSTTHPELVPILNEKKICFYVGFDPSSDNLTIFRLMAVARKGRAFYRNLLLIYRQLFRSLSFIFGMKI